jgi:MoaA/NifB/PqqE/SkfB family radical SAM enzyme
MSLYTEIRKAGAENVGPGSKVAFNNSTHLDRQFAALKYGIVPRKPRFLARVGKFYLKSFLLRGDQPLRYVDFAVDYACNLKCEHCFKTSLENKQAHPRLQISDYKRIARECIDLGAIHLSLQGGEATLLPWLEELVRNMSPNRVLFSITTNGTTITPEFAKKLHSWGVDQLTISIDSFTPEVHDRFRGVPGAFARTFNGLTAARRNGLNVQINTCVSKTSLYSRGFLDLVDYCCTEKIILNLVLAAPSGNWDASLEFVLDANDIRNVRALVKSTPYVRQDMDSIQIGRGCPAMKEALYITPNGDVLSCPFMHISFGNLHDEPLAAIRSRALKYPFLAAHAQQCLVAEDRPFIHKYLAKTFGRHDLPAGDAEVFGCPDQVGAEYALPPRVIVHDQEVAPMVAQWRRSCGG